VSQAVDYAEKNFDGALQAFMELLRVPSVSALPDHAADTRHAGELAVQLLRDAGIENAHLAEDPGGGYPVVRGDWLGAPDAPTVIMYSHYDVQPPDPLDEWETPPFEPSIRDGVVYARGAGDTKGHVVSLIKAVEALLKTDGRLPVNVKFAIEGEEESAGRALPNYLRAHQEEMAADAVLVADSTFARPGLPAITTGLRGILYTEIDAVGAAQDLHSGMYGGASPNPFNSLAWVLAGLKGPDGRILIPGFYDKVQEPGPDEARSLSDLGIDDAQVLRDEIGSDAFFGETDRTILERISTRPTLDIHGIKGGFTGDGVKTVIPSRATAKVSMRLVPDQDPREIFAAFEAHVQSLGTPGTRLSTQAMNTDPPVRVGTSGRGVQAMARALKRAFGADPAFIRIGGSIPVCTAFQEALGAELVITGWGLPDDRPHGPNEHFVLDQFKGGIIAAIAFLEEFGSAG
jgi:acetylornithine deacetylase/succinyl-diaminopimelate desuccinylase-like protein